MKILDLQTGRVHEYGDNCHDSLYVSSDGRYLTYYNLQNGDGSGAGDYRFVCDDDKVPAESQTADAIHAEVYFNIGGFNRRTWYSIDTEGLLEDHDYYLIAHKDYDTPIKAKYHDDQVPHFTFLDSENGMQTSYISDGKITHFMFLPDLPKGGNE